ncbi:hypothetical protein MIMGU_mgv1a024565mg, partial [Erythranthe guttata]
KDLLLSEDDDRVYKRKLWMKSLCHDPTCLKQLRVNNRLLNGLCDVLQKDGGLVATKNVTIKEIVALFLHILGHDQKNSTIATTFVRSGETVSRQFHIVLQAVLKIGKLYLNHQRNELFHERDAERWKWFPNAVGALDGTFVGLTVSAVERSRYRNRKGMKR